MEISNKVKLFIYSIQDQDLGNKTKMILSELLQNGEDLENTQVDDLSRYIYEVFNNHESKEDILDNINYAINQLTKIKNNLIKF